MTNEELLQKAEKYRKMANLARRYESVESNVLPQELYDRILLNNEKFGISSLVKAFLRDIKLGMHSQYDVYLFHYIAPQEPLLKKILETPPRRWGVGSLANFFRETKIIEKIVMRTMTEKEYNYYLNCDLREEIYGSDNQLNHNNP